jgi:hypothetical protein
MRRGQVFRIPPEADGEKLETYRRLFEDSQNRAL